MCDDAYHSITGHLENPNPWDRTRVIDSWTRIKTQFSLKEKYAISRRYFGDKSI